MWFKKLTRFGYLIKALLYVFIGFLTIKLSLGIKNREIDSQGALEYIKNQTFGEPLLLVVAVGLTAYSTWRFIWVIKDFNKKAIKTKKMFKRVFYVLNGLSYASIAYEAFILGVNSFGVNEGDIKKDWVIHVLELPFGRWLIGIIGSVVIGFGFYLFYYAIKAKFKKKLKVHKMKSTEKIWLVQITRVGIIAKGIVFVLIGCFMVQGAFEYDAEKIKNMNGIFWAIEDSIFGDTMLFLMGIGLISYAVYTLIQAKYLNLDR